MLRMCCGLTLANLFVRFFDMYCVATIPKSRFEFLDSLLIQAYSNNSVLPVCGLRVVYPEGIMMI